jgi:hypothetical protein
MGALTGFWKMLGNIGKRVFFRREPKISLFLTTAMYQTMIDTLAESLGGNYEEAMEILINLTRPLSEEMISNILFGTSVLGIKLKTLLSKFSDFKEFTFFVDLSIYAFFGPSSKEIFGKVRYIPATESEEKVDTYLVRLKSCPFCYPTMVPPEKLGTARFGKTVAVTIEQMIQLSQDFLQHNFQVTARETRCFHHGDPFGEIRVWLYPRDKLDLMQQNAYLKKIK